MPTVSHKFQERDERLPLLRGRDYSSYFKMLDDFEAERRNVAGRIFRMACAYGCVRIERGMKIWWYLHSSTRAHKMQLTTWDELGPVSHIHVDYPSDIADILDGEVTATTEEYKQRKATGRR